MKYILKLFSLIFSHLSIIMVLCKTKYHNYNIHLSQYFAIQGIFKSKNNRK